MYESDISVFGVRYELSSSIVSKVNVKYVIWKYYPIPFSSHSAITVKATNYDPFCSLLIIQLAYFAKLYCDALRTNILETLCLFKKSVILFLIQ